MRWTPEQLSQYMISRNSPLGRVPDGDPPDPGKESVLQSKIEAWCKSWGRPFISFRQSRRPHGRHLIPDGFPDMVIISPGGKVLFVELKAGKGRLSDEQKQAALQFMALGHSVHTINSYRAFLKLTGQK
jgi:hypothetical protein